MTGTGLFLSDGGGVRVPSGHCGTGPIVAEISSAADFCSRYCCMFAADCCLQVTSDLTKYLVGHLTNALDFIRA